jgi:hypothetical protein
MAVFWRVVRKSLVRERAPTSYADHQVGGSQRRLASGGGVSKLTFPADYRNSTRIGVSTSAVAPAFDGREERMEPSRAATAQLPQEGRKATHSATVEIPLDRTRRDQTGTGTLNPYRSSFSTTPDGRGNS